MTQYNSTVRYVVPTIDLREYQPDRSATKLVTKKFCEEHEIVPVTIAPGADLLHEYQRVLVIAMAEPENGASLLAELEMLTGMKVEAVRAKAQAIRDAIRTRYGADGN